MRAWTMFLAFAAAAQISNRYEQKCRPGKDYEKERQPRARGQI
jgi:hypothetical protein